MWGYKPWQFWIIYTLMVLILAEIIWIALVVVEAARDAVQSWLGRIRHD